VCSTREGRLARLREAIDEVAVAARAGPAEHPSPEEMAERVAGLWAMIAELDPGLAARLPGYCPDTGLRSKAGRGPAVATRAQPISGGVYFPTISTSIVAVTSGCSRTRT